MDPFDEFEFKPLTDGLGFHKKKVNLGEGVKSSGVLSSELNSRPVARMPDEFLNDVSKPTVKTRTFDDVLAALESTPIKRPKGLEFSEPLPTAGGTKDSQKAMDINIDPQPVSRSPFPQPEAYKPPKMKKVPLQSELASVGTRRGAADSPPPRLQPATVNVGSAILDAVIVVALSMVFLVALFMVTKVDAGQVMANLSEQTMTQASMVVLFLAVMQMYLIISRSFYGRTIGEWTFDLQIGEDREQTQESYPLRVTMRSLLVMATGIIVLPLASAIMGRDLAGQITGVRLFQSP